MPRRAVRLLEWDSRSLERELGRNPLVIVPVGALEAHGPHLPLGADQLQAEATALALAERVGGLVAPTLPYGVCDGARRFPGTVSLSIASLQGMVEEILRELGRMGARRVLVLSGHAAARHMAALREAADRARLAVPGLSVVVLSDYEFVYELRGREAPPTDGHAGLLETSRVLAIAPETVGPERPAIVDRRSPHRSGDPTAEEWPESVVGDTRSASPELGQRLQDHVLRRLEATVREQLPA
jgi:creatinine amidohydrolase